MPTFTPFLPRHQFLPRQAFYPNFTPFAILCALRLPRFYPRGKTAHFLLVNSLLTFLFLKIRIIFVVDMLANE